MPGGVNSPVRAFRAVLDDPIFLARGQGPLVWDVDGNRYVDFVGAWGPMILGHAHPVVVAALQDAASRGFSFGAPTEAENALIKAIMAAMPAMERVRLVNSGTEAVMSSIRLARAYTQRDLIIKFVGCYHGHSDALLVKAGSGVATFGLPDSPGVPAGAAANTLSLPFNDFGAVAHAFETHPQKIAGILLEPVVGNAGVIPPRSGFLEQLRDLATRDGSLLIFDEVMTGFRVAYGGAQALYNVFPDLTCLAKIVGGGVPCGAYGGRAEIMALVAPEGPVYQAGTMSGNPLATAAGLATLEVLGATGAYDRLEETSNHLACGLDHAAQMAGVPLCVQRVGSMVTPFFHFGPISDWESASGANRQQYAAFHRGMLQRGIYLPPSQFEAWFVSMAHGDAELARTVTAARAALRELD